MQLFVVHNNEENANENPGELHTEFVDMSMKTNIQGVTTHRTGYE